MTSHSPFKAARYSLAGILIFSVLSGCAGSKVPPPGAITPPPLPEEAVTIQEESISALRTLDEILGPIDFDPDTVLAGRFDTGRMWTFDAPPLDYFAEAYGFRPDAEWLKHAQLGALRFGGGCSASFVSSDGLVFTNHHCGRDYVTQVSQEGEHLLENGFYAATLEEERMVEGLFVDQLVEITDVTGRIHGAMDAAADDATKTAAAQQEIEQIRTEFNEKNGLINQVVELFNGGRYSVYTYRRYEDVRLVMAPELDIGYFGGDPDNFTYPRYNLDCSFFRVYDEDGNPLDTSEFYFKWSNGGPKKGEPVFVLGNPGSTTRLNTVSQLAYSRDFDNPAILNLLRSRMKAVRAFLDSNPDFPNWEEMDNQYFGLSNSEKAYSGIQRGLQNAWMMARKADWEESFRQAVLNDPELSERYGDPWTEIAEARYSTEPFGNIVWAFRFGNWMSSAHLSKGFLLEQYRYMLSVGMSADSEPVQNLAAQILTPIQVHPDLERGMLEAQLGDFLLLLGPDDSITSALLGMRQPASAAETLLSQTALGDTTEVKRLIEGAPGSIETSSDPMISAFKGSMERLVQMQMVMSQANVKEQAARARLARAVYDVYGTSIPPDATFTLRIADGIVTNYPYNGTVAPVWTTFYGLYDRWASHGKVDPWELPERWQNPPGEFDLDTPLNFVATCDIIGGNSGSPVVNRNLEVVGVAFDGNIESLPGEFIYLPELNRCISVHSEGILEAIRDLFGFKGLADELSSGALPPSGR